MGSEGQGVERRECVIRGLQNVGTAASLRFVQRNINPYVRGNEMKLNIRPKTLAQNVLYYSILALLAMPWGSHSRWSGDELTIRVALILMVSAGFALSGRGSCRA